MEITLPPELQAIVNEKVESGQYLSPSDVVREALRVLNDRDAARESRLADIRRKVAEGLEQAERGETVGFESGAAFMDYIRAEGRKVLAARHGSDKP